MPMDWQVLAIPMVAGVDSKSDAKTIRPPKLATLQNGVFTSEGSIRKRGGYTVVPRGMNYLNASNASTPLAGLKALMGREDELLTADRNMLYSYDPVIGHSSFGQSWVRKGTLESIGVKYTSPLSTASEMTTADRASAPLGTNLLVYAWEDSRGGAYYAIADTGTGQGGTPVLLSATASRPRVVGYSSSASVTTDCVFVYYYDSATTAIKAVRIQATVLATTTFSIVTDVNATNPYYDVERFGTTCMFLAYHSNAGTATINVGSVDISGSYSGVTWVITNAVQGVALAIGNSTTATATKLGVMAAADGGNTIRAIVYDPANLSSVLASGAIDTTARTYRNITGAWETWGNFYRLRVFYEAAGASSNLNIVYTGSLANDGSSTVVAGAVYRRHSGLASRALALQDSGQYDTFAYVMLVQDSTLQSTYFLTRSEPSYSVTSRILGRILPGTAGGVTAKISHLPQLQRLDFPGSAGQGVSFLALNKTRLDTYQDTRTAYGVFTQRQLRDVSLSFPGADANASITGITSHRSAQIGRCLYVSGAQLWEYDGAAPVEAGFHLYPEGVTGVASNGGGSMASSLSYSYRVYFEWYNARGERELSSFAAAITVALGGADNTVTLTIPTLAHTHKDGTLAQKVGIAVFRTQATPTNDALFYRVSANNPATTGDNGYTLNSLTADTVAFVDKLADATIVTHELDYQNDGELDNIAPPPHTILAAGKKRLYLAGVEDPNQIWASKIHQSGQAVAFNDALTMQVPEIGGPITALGIINDALVVFKDSRIYVVPGDGPDNLGNGAFPDPQVITSDVGCWNQGSLASTRAGLMFQSRRGIYLLDQQFQVSYVGADVDGFAGPGTGMITAAGLGPLSQVRFDADGGTVVFDLTTGQWSQFTGTLTYSSVVESKASGATPSVYLLGDNAHVYIESSTTFTDNGTAYSLVIVTGWLKLASLQGFWRARRAFVLGTSKSSHTARMTIYYDYDTGTSYVLNWTPSGTVYQYAAQLPRQKCEAIKFRIEDISPTGSGEGYDIQEIAIEAGMKRGGIKLPTTKRI